MFVQSNTLSATKSYFSQKLQDLYSEREIDFFFRFSAIERLKINEFDLRKMETILLSESDLLYFRSVANRLLKSEPFQHILGNTEFYGLVLLSDSRALIPRPETEELVDWIVKDHKSIHLTSIQDLCTGSGCIALALKNEFQDALVQGVDVSQAALDLARSNASFTNLDVTFVQDDVLEAKVATSNWDVLVSNPPYITDEEKRLMHANVLDFEPHLALFVPNDKALIFYDKIGRYAYEHLNKNGKLYLEINEFFGSETVALLREIGFTKVELRKDLQGKDRMIKAER